MHVRALNVLNYIVISERSEPKILITFFILKGIGAEQIVLLFIKLLNKVEIVYEVNSMFTDLNDNIFVQSKRSVCFIITVSTRGACLMSKMLSGDHLKHKLL